jgi:DNA-binding response OmpR family regulator
MECAPIKPRDGCSVLLVVDDYPENLISMRALLQREDWHVVTAASGVEALGLLLEHDVDLVLLDVMMPGMDGFEVARLMRGSQRTQLTPIIFLSAHAQSPAAMLEGYASGAIDYLLKPFDPNILKPKVQALLEHQRNRRALQRLSHDLESARAFNASVLDNAADGQWNERIGAAWGKQPLYFKAGAYVQDNSGNSKEGARVTFAKLDIDHD